MRVMVLVPANEESESGALPSEQVLRQMGHFNEELVKAGVMLAGDGLKPTSKAARVVFEGGKTTVIDGPFTESKEIVAGYWIWQVNSLEDAIAWVKRAPFGKFGSERVAIEIRPIFEATDFAASDPSGEIRKKEAELAATIAKQRR